MQIDATMKQGDQLPSLAITCTDPLGRPIDVSAATAVSFKLLHAWRDEVIFERAAVSTDAANGEIQYDWQAGDTDTPGTFRGVFQVTFPGGVMTFPSRGHLTVVVEADPESA